MIPAPTWFQNAFDKGMSCDELWAVVMFKAFNQFPHNQLARPWSVEDCCMGNFSPAFDLQPGIQESRERWYLSGSLTTEQRRLIREALAKRGISLRAEVQQ